jgi:predicted dehydrogenase
MALKIAFMGFRHGHIFDLYTRAKESPDYEVVAACEEDAETRAQLAESGKAEITHDNYGKMLNEVECDVIAVGDYYGKRGSIIITALDHGKHVIADKPICTSIYDLDTIQALSSQKGLKVGCMLDLRDNGTFRKVHELVRGGAIGEVHGITFGGQHPLMIGTRPGWYFEEGKHGGTINDIGIHAFDLIPWVTGLNIAEITCSRSWNAFPKDIPHMRDAGMFMLRLENEGGVLGDVSYFMPDSMGYTLDLYWRFTIWGREGFIETSYNLRHIRLAKDGNSEVEIIQPSEPDPGGYLRSFTNEVTTGQRSGVTTDDVLRASRIALLTQKAGDEGLCRVNV